MGEMSQAVQAQLLALNRTFYSTVARPFDRTRQGVQSGMVELVEQLPHESVPLRVLDAGCGNGRFAAVLAQQGHTAVYVGVDQDEQLLAMAAEQTATLAPIEARFVTANLGEADWSAVLAGEEPFDVVVCLATLHHFPGHALRRRILRELAGLLKHAGLLALSTWQFLGSARLASKLVDWSVIGLSPDDVEAGDALMPWKQGQYALRYVHQIDADEIQALATGLDLRIVDQFRADGKEGNLNLYTLFERK